MADAPGGRLNSWKEIAEHLHRDVRTVRRWEHERGMPVHRVPGGGNASVFAFAEEIDKWLAGGAGRPGPPVASPQSLHHSRRRRSAALAVSVLALAAIALALLGLRRAGAPRPVQRLTIADNSIRALDDRGQVRWEYRLPARFVANDVSNATFVGSPDASGDQLLALAAETADSQQGVEASLFAFHADGRLRWRFTPRDRLRFASGDYGPSWSCQGSVLVPLVVDGQRRLAWVLHHLTWWPSRVIILDDTGARRGEFVNSGWIGRIVQSPDGRFLLVSGVSNAANAPILAVLDARQPSGASPERADSPYACLNCPSGEPVCYIAFDRSALSRLSAFRVQAPIVGAVDNGFEVRITESLGEPRPETIYEFSSDFRLRRASRGDGYRDAVGRLRAGGPLAGDAAAVREDEDVPGVRVWHPGRGWATERPAYPPATAATGHSSLAPRPSSPTTRHSPLATR